MPIWDFKDQVVLITGGAGGLGIELSKAFVRSGAHVYICDIKLEKLENAKKMINDMKEEWKGNYYAEQMDVNQTPALQAWVRSIAEKEGKIDVLVNAVGICTSTSWDQVTEPLWNDVMDTNLRSAFFATQAAAIFMKEKRYGRIVNVGSIGAYSGGAIAMPAYCAAKAGVQVLAKSFANALSPYGINVNSVSPGPFETEMIADFSKEAMARIESNTPTRRIGKSEDIVHAILFLSNVSSSQITGAALDINGGLYMR